MSTKTVLVEILAILEVNPDREKRDQILGILDNLVEDAIEEGHDSGYNSGYSWGTFAMGGEGV